MGIDSNQKGFRGILVSGRPPSRSSAFKRSSSTSITLISRTIASPFDSSEIPVSHNSALGGALQAEHSEDFLLQELVRHHFTADF